MNPPTATASLAEIQVKNAPRQRPYQPVPSLPYNEIIAENIDLLEDNLAEILRGQKTDDIHLIKDFGRVVTKHPILSVSASIGNKGQLQEIAIDPKSLAISRYRSELIVMRKEPLTRLENTPFQMNAPYEIIDFGDFYQTAGSLVVSNVVNSLHRYNGPRQQRHETQIC